MKKIKKNALNILSILGGGILVSATWDFLIKDSFLKFGRWILEFSSRFSLKFIDFVYSNPSESDTVFIVLPTCILFIVIIWFTVYTLLKSYLYQLAEKKVYTDVESTFESLTMSINEGNNSVELPFDTTDHDNKQQLITSKHTFSEKIIQTIIDNEGKLTKFFNITAFLITSFWIILSIFVLSISIVKYSIKIGTEKNLGILKPYVTGNQYDLLYSQYLQIESREDYKKLFSQLEKVGKLNNIVVLDPSKSK